MGLRSGGSLQSDSLPIRIGAIARLTPRCHSIVASQESDDGAREGAAGDEADGVGLIIQVQKTKSHGLTRNSVQARDRRAAETSRLQSATGGKTRAEGVVELPHTQHGLRVVGYSRRGDLA